MEQIIVPTIVSFDPGRTTGYCAVVPLGRDDGGYWSFDVLEAREIKWQDRYSIQQILKGHIDEGAYIQVVMESFNLYAHRVASQINSDFPAVQVIGLIQAFCHILGLQEPVMQPASVRKRASIYSYHKDIVKGSPHKRDAYQHARYYVVNHSDEWFPEQA